VRTDSDARRRFIRSLIETTDVPNQQVIRESLAEAGHDVTQATISRDLAAIGATRVREDGGSRYRLVEVESWGEDQEAMREAIDEFATSIVVSGHLLVLKVPPGAAQFVASRIDAAAVDGVLGSIAGDDTILVIADESQDPHAVVRRLEGTG
jgi:transcriptional regulator of arginine metabolism